MAQLTIVGVYHAYHDLDFPKVMDYVSKIPLGSKVSLENPEPIKKLRARYSNLVDLSYSCNYIEDLMFFCSIAEKLDKKRIRMEGIDHLQMCKMQRLCLRDSKVDPNLEDVFDILTFFRSIHMYRQAIENESTHAIMGSFHAYDIENLGLDAKVTYITHPKDRHVGKKYYNLSKILADEYQQTGSLQIPPELPKQFSLLPTIIETITAQKRTLYDRIIQGIKDVFTNQ